MLVAVATAAVVFPALWGAFEPAPTIDLEVVNPTRRDIHVSVRSQGDRGVVGIGTVAPDETYQFREVVEHGDAWVVIFSSAGVVGGELSLSRHQLAERDWIITIPMEVDRELAAAGVSPSP
jgi:hypothetical protein